MAIKWSGAQAGDTCLDICCGSGDLAQRLARQVGPSGQVFGVDFAAAQLAVAEARSAHLFDCAPITWIEADALQLPFPANHFDAITMGYGLRNVTDIAGALQEIHRVLKPGARAAILDLNRSLNPWVRSFQQWYLDRIVVPMAQHYGLTQEYAYLGPSLEQFPTGPEQVQLAQQVGFDSAIHYPIANDTMGVLVLTK